MEKFTLTEPCVKVIDGTVQETVSKNIYMRKSLRGGVAGALENFPASKAAVVAAAVVIVALAASGTQQPAALWQLLDSFGGR
jgi:hypothetical protein